jgi:hypothetical protein
LCELLADCRAAGVRAALLWMPEGPTFRTWYPPGVGPTVHDWLTAVAAAHGAALIERFSERLAREGALPLLRGAAAGDGP